MSATPTIAQLIAEIKAAVPAIAANQARKMIKDNNIRSLTKANTVAAQHAAKTAEELAAAFGDAMPDDAAPVARTAVAKPAKKTVDKVSKTDTKPKATAKDKTAAKPKAERRAVTIVNPGPRGFRFGDVWVASVKNGVGVALAAQNRPKLNAHAETLNIANAAAMETAELVKKMQAKL